MSNYRRIEVGERVGWPDQFRPRLPSGNSWCTDDGWMTMDSNARFTLPENAFNEYRRCVDEVERSKTDWERKTAIANAEILEAERRQDEKRRAFNPYSNPYPAL